MPLSEYKSMALGAFPAARVASGVPATGKVERVFDLEADDLRFDPEDPDADLHSGQR